ncbi:MAG: hypothetical protein Kow0077_15470 [Anaerolineae bacterium]
MKRAFVTIFAVLLVFMVASPALAMGGEGHSCPHTHDTIADLANCFNHALSMGHIDNEGVAQSLQAKLAAAQGALDRGKAATAVNILQALINEITAQSGVHIDPMHAQHMIMHVEQVIGTL